ncbi:MAG: hypothetical protein KDD33_09640 [Bdellovibrionales bacterium]|nr:hypothetical protein [Bdellovibrionales bacterium]
MIFLLVILTAFGQTDYCKDKNWVAPHYADLQKKIDDKLAQSAHLVPIAKEADQVLSKLIQAKSPILFNWLEKRQLMSAKEEEIAKKWRQYYLENFILSEFPNKNEKINAAVEGTFQSINQTAFKDSFKKRAEKLFKQAKADSLKVVNGWLIDEKAKKEISERLGATELYWFHGLKGSKFEKMPLEFLKWGVAYDPIPNHINMGVQSLRYKSDSTLYSVFAHELGHAFDSCRWGAFFKSKNPFEKLHQCLRSQESTKAQKRDDSKLEELKKSGKLPIEVAQSLVANPTCNRTFYPPIGLQQEQILEVFADWFAAEVVAVSPYLDDQVRADLCEFKELNPGSSYISNQDRLEKIYFTQPKIQAALKVATNAKYCPL